MLDRLFARLTTSDDRAGQRLFDAAVTVARSPRWYIEGQVPDTVEGRFAVLATILAVTMIRLEGHGRAGEAAGVTLTERFVAAMDTEVREMGVGDPSVGKQVRSLVSALGARVGTWREALGDPARWSGALVGSIYRGAQPAAGALAASSAELGRALPRIDQAIEAALLDDRQ